MSNLFVGWIKSAFLQLVEDPDVTKWIDARIAGAITAGESALAADIKSEINAVAENLEASVLRELESLPAKIVGAAEKTVMDIVPGVEDIVGGVKGEVAPLLTNLQTGIGSLINPQSIAQEVANIIKGLLPFPLGPFGGGAQ